MTPIYNDSERVAWFVCERIGRFIHPPYFAIGYESGGAIKIGAIFNDYYVGGNIELTIAADAPLTRGVIRDLARYVFVQLKCRRVSLTTPLKYERVIRMAKRFGFQQEGVRSDYFGAGQHAAMLGLKISRCKWLRV